MWGNNLIAKIVNMDDADNRTHGESLFLVIRTNDETAVVSVTKLANLEPVFAFEFEHSGVNKIVHTKDQTHTHHFKAVKSLEKHSRSFKEALIQINTPHMVEQAFQQVEFFAERRALETLNPDEERIKELK